MRQGPVTLDDLMARGLCLEIGCHHCRLHVYIRPDVLALPGTTTVPEVGDLLKCPQCGVENTEAGHPVWSRPDARPPRMGASVTQ